MEESSVPVSLGKPSKHENAASTQPPHGDLTPLFYLWFLFPRGMAPFLGDLIGAAPIPLSTPLTLFSHCQRSVFSQPLICLDTTTIFSEAPPNPEPRGGLSHAWERVSRKPTCDSHISSYLKCFFYRLPQEFVLSSHQSSIGPRPWSDAAEVRWRTDAIGNLAHSAQARAWPSLTRQ